MPWTEKQKRFLLSKDSPLTGAQRTKMLKELHSDPSLGHRNALDVPLPKRKKRKK